MSIRISASWFLLPCLLSIPALRADIIYTNFGTGDAYSSGTGLIVTNDNTAWSSVAIAFTPAAAYNLTSIEFVASDIIPDDLGVSLGIFADNGGEPGGPPLESFTVSGPLAQFGNAAPILTVSSVLQPLLQANVQYWVGMNAPAGDLVIWNQSVTSSLGFSETDGSGNWSTAGVDQGAVEIDGTLAPVSPDTPTPLLTQPLDVVLSQTDDSIGSTPEPCAWMLVASGMIFIARRARDAQRTWQAKPPAPPLQ